MHHLRKPSVRSLLMERSALSTLNWLAKMPVHLRSLINAFVFTVVNLASCEISVPEQAGLSFTVSEILETGFLASRPK